MKQTEIRILITKYKHEVEVINTSLKTPYYTEIGITVLIDKRKIYYEFITDLERLL